MIEIVETNLATKQDIKGLTSGLRQEMQDLNRTLSQLISELATSINQRFSSYEKKHEADFNSHRSDVKIELANIQNRLLIRLGALSMGGIAVLGFVLTFVQMVR